MATRVKLSQTNGQPWIRLVEFDSPQMSDLWGMLVHATGVRDGILYVQPGIRLPDGSASPLAFSPFTGEPLQYEISKADLKAVGATEVRVLTRDLTYDPDMATLLSSPEQAAPEVEGYEEPADAVATDDVTAEGESEDAVEVEPEAEVEAEVDYGEDAAVEPAVDDSEFEPDFDPDSVSADALEVAEDSGGEPVDDDTGEFGDFSEEE